MNSQRFPELTHLIGLLVFLFILLVIFGIAAVMTQTHPSLFKSEEVVKDEKEKSTVVELWIAPDLASLPDTDEGRQIRYGQELIAQTSSYIGPLGSVSKLANGMNCQNCHLEAGTKPYGNNYGSVAANYPKFRARSGGMESIEKRVNDCFQRSLGGSALDSLSKEMRAIVAYIKWLGKDVPKGQVAAGSGLKSIKWLERAADPKRGKKLYLQQCQVCHGDNTEGQRLSANSNYIYPPLSGGHSFTTAAGLFRISNFAKYIHANMPNGATYEKPILTEEQAWDIAAYVLSLPRATKVFEQDWPKLATKPIDHPFGPYADQFQEQQHKYGPFKPIEEFYQSQKK